MKKDLTISGKIRFYRKEITSMISKFIQETEGLITEKVVPVDKNDKPLDLDNYIVFVHQAKPDEPITKKYDDNKPKSKLVKSGFRRPNFGIGRLLKDILADGEEHKLMDLMKEVKPTYPQINTKVLKGYLNRVDMVGTLIENDGVYLKV